MKESMWGYLIISLGIIIIAVIFLIQRLTTTSEQDYFLVKETMKASMPEAIDYGTYMKSGKIVMSKEKFVAIFTRRFAESVPADKTYQIDFYDIHEYPPKATVKVSTKTGETVVNQDAINLDINQYITGILETNEVDLGYIGWKLTNPSEKNYQKQVWQYYENGELVTGEKLLKTSSKSNESYYYYFNDKGEMQTGWVKRGSAYYLYSPFDIGNDGTLDGRRIQGMNNYILKVTLNDSKTYYFDKTGKCYTNSAATKLCNKTDLVSKFTKYDFSNKKCYQCNGTDCFNKVKCE